MLLSRGGVALSLQCHGGSGSQRGQSPLQGGGRGLLTLTDISSLLSPFQTSRRSLKGAKF